jgi:NAD(P)-dependent dehydrogenase (short-subunit alcohol dehydrogenase family)
MLLRDRVVFVTGGARGIGRGVAEAVAEEGAHVAIGDPDPAREETARLVRERGRRALALSLDVTDQGAVEGAIESVLSSLGGLDGWVNNAGTLRMDAALEARAEDALAQMRVNVLALLACSQAAAGAMIRLGRPGAIVNVASNAGKVGYPNMAAYNASKAAVISLTRSLSAEWAEHRINVNAVCPGGVLTPMLRDVAAWLAPRLGLGADELLSTMKPKQMERHVQPLEVGRVVAFLLSDHASIIRGQAVNVDGGDTPY